MHPHVTSPAAPALQLRLLACAALYLHVLSRHTESPYPKHISAGPGARPPPVPTSQREAAADNRLQPEEAPQVGRVVRQFGMHFAPRLLPLVWFDPTAVSPTPRGCVQSQQTRAAISGCRKMRACGGCSSQRKWGQGTKWEARSGWARRLPATLPLHFFHPIHSTSFYSDATRIELHQRQITK